MAKHTYIRRHPETQPKQGEQLRSYLNLARMMKSAGASEKAIARMLVRKCSTFKTPNRN